ncbi:hypothetical protein [Polyangium sp. 15x6]|uniref:WD40 domain-containing protein n=1 Tax=Polyangium sp. 15x6 TaxID=3042687 RepID=UPI00249A6F68|nr:hypothetical protein [Polyangium sp. 15x6]MDI3282139.1 hypothetical protein [Polyangium sp. 15x6]
MRRWGAALAMCAATTWGHAARAEKAADDAQELVPGGEPASVLEGVDWLPFWSNSVVAWSPDGRMLATAQGFDVHTIRLWDLATGREVRRWSVQGSGAVERLEWRPDGHTLVLTSAKGNAIAWDKDTGMSSEIEVPAPNVAAAERLKDVRVDVSLDGKKTTTLQVIAFDGGNLYATEALEDKTLIVGHDDNVVLRSIPSVGQPVQFDPTGRTILIGTTIWDIPSGSVQTRLRTRPLGAELAFLGNGDRLAVGQSDGTVWLWDMDRGIPTRILPGDGYQVFDIEDLTRFAKCSTCIAVSYYNGVIRVLDTTTGRDVFEPVRGDGTSRLHFEPRSMELVAENGYQVNVWAPGAAPSTIDMGQGFPVFLASALSPRAPVLAVRQAESGHITLWGISSRQKKTTLLTENSGSALAWSPDGRTLEVGYAGISRIERWDAEAGQKLSTLETDAPVVALAFHADGRLLAGGCQNGAIEVWSAAPGPTVWKEQVHRAAIHSMAFHPTKHLLASSGDGLVAAHDVSTARSEKRIFLGGPTGWVGVDERGLVHRRDPGGFVQRLDKDGTLHPVLPPMTAPSSLSISQWQVKGEPGDGPDAIGEKSSATSVLEVVVENNGAGPAYWVTLEMVDTRKGLMLLDPPTIPRLEPRTSATLHARMSWSAPNAGETPSAPIRFHIKDALGTSLPFSTNVNVRAPRLVYEALDVSGDTVRFTLSNEGNQISGPLTIEASFIDGQRKESAQRPGVPSIPGGDSVEISFAIPTGMGRDQPFTLELSAKTDVASHWPRHPRRTWSSRFDNLRPSLPIALYGAIGLGALLLAAAVMYARIYKNPLVVRATLEPMSLQRYPLGEIANVDRALLRAKRRDPALTAAGISKERWRNAMLAAQSGDGALAGFSDAVGAVLGDCLDDLPENVSARTLKLPPLVLRFAQETALVAITGGDLEEGATRKLAAAVHQGGRGPRQALALDFTKSQRMADALRELPGVRFVVLSADRLRDLLLAERPSAVLEQSLREQLEVADLSPYQTASGVEQDALFFGREREIRTIADRSLRNFILVGARQMGKSALLQALNRRLKAREDVDVHYITLAGSDLVHHIRDHFDPGVEPIEATPSAFAKVAAGTKDRPRLFLLDEADQFVAEDTRRDHAITQVMRKLAQDGLAHFVLAGFWDLYAATWLDAKHPLLNFAELIRLGPLDDTAATDLATKPMASLGLRWDSPETVASLVRGAGYRANLIVLACKALIESLDVSTRVLTAERLAGVVRSNKDLREQLRVLRKNIYAPLHRAIVYQALLLEEPTRDGLLAALRERGFEVSRVSFDQALELLELAYVIVVDPEGRVDFPVPWVRAQLVRDGRPEDLLEEEMEEHRKLG